MACQHLDRESFHEFCEPNVIEVVKCKDCTKELARYEIRDGKRVREIVPERPARDNAKPKITGGWGQFSGD